MADGYIASKQPRSWLKSFTIGWTEDGQVTRLHIDCLFISHPPTSREISSSLGDEELVYLFYYFGFPSTLVLAITGSVRLQEKSQIPHWKIISFSKF